jgi:hypothetical protein
MNNNLLQNLLSSNCYPYYLDDSMGFGVSINNNTALIVLYSENIHLFLNKYTEYDSIVRMLTVAYGEDENVALPLPVINTHSNVRYYFKISKEYQEYHINVIKSLEKEILNKKLSVII